MIDRFVWLRYAVLMLLFMTIFIGSRTLLQSLFHRSGIRGRLTYLRRERLLTKIDSAMARYANVHRHVSYALASTIPQWSAGSFMLLSIGLCLIGGTAGVLLFSSPKGMLVLSALLGGTPYLIIRMQLLTIQMRTRLEFLPAVEVFYQTYILSVQKNIRSVLRHALDGHRMQTKVQVVFEQLQRNLSASGDPDEALRVFSYTLGHVWAAYFANILRFGLIEGADVTNNLRTLITDMRKAQRTDQAERNRLLEIRLANFSPILFLVLFFSVNFKLNFAGAYYYYLLDPAGREMILDALLLIFGSFLMGIYLSVRRM